MSEDLLKRLREGTFGADETKTDCVINAHMNRAATEIERLNAERDALRAALKYARRFLRKDDCDVDYVDAALKETETKK